MFIAKIENGVATEFPITEKEVRQRLGNVSLPALLTNQILEPLGFAIVAPGKPQDFPVQTKDLMVYISSIEKIDNVWKRTYSLKPVPEADKAARTERKWKEVREKRAKLMLDFDWRILRNNREVALGIPTTDNITALHTYMQALATITDQPDPFLIQYPVFEQT